MQVLVEDAILKCVKARSRKKRPRRSGCPIGFALDILGDRWTLLVIRDMVFGRKRTFSEFLASEEGIATNILTDRLHRLESAGLLRKETDPRSQVRVLYRLTEKGIDLVPLLVDLAVWGAKHDPETAAPKAFLKRAAEERESLLAEITSALRGRAERKR